MTLLPVLGFCLNYGELGVLEILFSDELSFQRKLLSFWNVTTLHTL